MSSSNSKLLEAVRARHSVREYIDRPIEGDVLNALLSMITDCNRESGLHMQLTTDEPEAFGSSLLAHYGRFRNVRNYICLVGRKEAGGEECAGYFGEKVVIGAQALGLNTCWAGLTYSKGKAKCDIADGERLFALIAIGYGQTQGKQSKSKTVEQVCENRGLRLHGSDGALSAPCLRRLH